MSEEAYYWQFKREHGHYPDEDGPPNIDEIFCAECPVCEEPSNPDECVNGVCPNCQESERSNELNPERTEPDHTKETGGA